MLMAALMMMAQAGPPVPDAPDAKQAQDCLLLAKNKPANAVATAAQWIAQGGGYAAQLCLGMAYSTQQKWPDAAQAFQSAAQSAERQSAPEAGNYWAQAGNAWALAGDYDKAAIALGKAIDSGGLKGLDLGEAYLDRARVHVVAKDNGDARADLDQAIKFAGDDPLTWLLSATLARRMNDLTLARKHIDEALKRAPDDASVQLEAGNIAALEGAEAAAKSAWTKAMNLAPGTETSIAARAALKQFGPDAGADKSAGDRR